MNLVFRKWQGALLAILSLFALPITEADAANNRVSKHYSNSTKTGFAISYEVVRTKSRPYARVGYSIPIYYGSSLVRATTNPYNNCVAYTPRAVSSRVPGSHLSSSSSPSYSGFDSGAAGIGGGGDYLNRMSGESRWSNGKHIAVYVAPGRASFPQLVANSFNKWAAACGGKFSWSFTSDQRRADYTIGWTSHTQQLSTGDEAGLTTTDTVDDADSNHEIIEHATTRVLTRYNGRALSDDEIAKTVLHEVGHGLGLEGHSSNPRDIMYYAVSGRQKFSLTPRDANTISRLYAG